KPSCVAVELPYLQFVYVVPVGLTVTDLTACATVLRVTLRLAGVAAEAETVVTRATVAAARAPQAAPFDEPVPPPPNLVSRILYPGQIFTSTSSGPIGAHSAPSWITSTIRSYGMAARSISRPTSSSDCARKSAKQTSSLGTKVEFRW